MFLKNMTKKKWYLVIGIIAVVASYLYYRSNYYWYYNIPVTSGKEVFDGDPEPLRPSYKESVATLWGVDSDNDGVRDEIEIYINRSFDDKLQRQALKEMIRLWTLEYEFVKQGKRELFLTQNQQRLNFLDRCFDIAFDSSYKWNNPTHKLRKLYINSKKRKTLDIQRSRFLVGTWDSVDDQRRIEMYFYLRDHCPFDQEVREHHAKIYKEKNSRLFKDVDNE